MRTKLLVVLAAALIPAAMANAAVIEYVAGPQDVVAKTMTVDVMINGGEQTAGMNLYVAVGDGGPNLGGVSGPLPSIAAVSFAGGIWDGHNTGIADSPFPLPDLYYATTTTTPTGTIALAGKLCTITLNLTAEKGDVLRLGLPAFEIASDFGGVIPVDPTFEIPKLVPEPAAMVLLAIGGLFLRRRMA